MTDNKTTVPWCPSEILPFYLWPVYLGNHANQINVIITIQYSISFKWLQKDSKNPDNTVLPPTSMAVLDGRLLNATVWSTPPAVTHDQTFPSRVNDRQTRTRHRSCPKTSYQIKAEGVKRNYGGSEAEVGTSASVVFVVVAVWRRRPAFRPLPHTQRDTHTPG